MAIPERFLEELSGRVNIVDVVSAYVPLTKRGANYWGLCPFHHEKTPSFSVNEPKQIFHCFGCGKGGGPYRFLMEMESLTFPEAVEKLAQREGMTVPEEGRADQGRQAQRRRILELNRQAARFYREMLARPEGARVAAYIRQQRRISPKFSARFGLGAAPDSWDALTRAMVEQGYDKAELLQAGLAVAGKNGGIYDKFRNRLMLPVIDARGDVIGFTSRVMDDTQPKYLNTPETAIFKKRSILYGINYAKKTKRPNLILVEGNIDVITMHQAGFDNTVATMGTALTEDHVRQLARYGKQLVLCLDNDAAGLEATQRAITALRDSGIEVRVLPLPRRKTPEGELVKQDPDDYIKRYGSQAFEGLMEGSATPAEYRLELLREEFDLERDDQKTKYLLAAAELVAGLSSPVEREIYGNRAADAAGISHQAMEQEVERLRRRKGWEQRRRQERQALALAQKLQPRERALRYQDLHSARAEEGLLRVVLLDGEYFQALEGLGEEDFSSPLLGRAYALLKRQWQTGQTPSLAALDGDFTPQEADHLAAIAQRPQSAHTARQALEDYKRVILGQRGRAGIHTGEDLAQFRDALRQKKRYGG